MTKRVMCADDEEVIRLLVSSTLANDDRCGFLIAKDGQEALDLARREKPDVLLLDVKMPFIDGVDVCRLLKEDPTTADINIVILSAWAQEHEKQRALDAGANDYFTKPFSPMQLLDKVHDLLAL